ncbi:enoyl-CoA delta isomerase 2-like isoform X2 [Phyllobates terribilis]|uniref:enoyl-CoA delta isomerase 2-like isoform X2 n=1 Tax=Phyllobates terribilis TaxID=111132 RepID=UPI003CCABE78
MTEFKQSQRESKDNVLKGNQNVHLVQSLVSSESAIQSRTRGHSKYETIEVLHLDNITKIVLKRAEKKNAFSFEMYKEVASALDEAGKDDSVLTVITGQGDFFSSGNDLNNALRSFEGGLEEAVKGNTGKLVCKVIDFPKPLVAMVNGPAIGIATTILGLFDLVYASDKATFNTPFSKLGQHPEGCSSYTFPKMMGLGKATEVLLFNKTLTAQEACNVGLVTEVFPDATFQQEVWSRLRNYATLPKTCLALSKELMRNVEKEKLHEVCEKEFELLAKRANSEDSIKALQEFFQRKSKL